MPVEHRRGLGELDVAVVDDLNPIPPRIDEVERARRLDGDVGPLEC